MNGKTDSIYRCPKCHEDVTYRVLHAAREKHPWPNLLAGIAGITNRRQVTIQCPNGHWARYPVWKA